jgi:hypothetical protein
MNRDAPAQARAHPALSGQVWDDATPIHEQTSVSDDRPPAATADPAIAASQVTAEDIQ